MYVFMYLFFFYDCMLSLSQNTLKNSNIVKDFYNLNFYIFKQNRKWVFYGIIV